LVALLLALLCDWNLGDVLLACVLYVFLFLQVGKKTERPTRAPSSPAGLFFQHAGHRFVPDSFLLENSSLIASNSQWFVIVFSFVLRIPF
jgi:hypothetical protein